MSEVPISASIDIVVQLILLALLIIGILLLKKGRNVQFHGILFAIVTVLNLGAIIIRMVPALSPEIQEAAPAFLTEHFSLMIVHVLIGLIAEALAVIIVLRWAINRFNVKGCYRKGFMGKGIMDLTMVCWIVSLGLGLIFYAQSLVA